MDKDDPEWMGSLNERLLALYKPQGIPVFSPQYMQPLIEKGLAEFTPIKGWEFACRLTPKGIKAAEALKENRGDDD